MEELTALVQEHMLLLDLCPDGDNAEDASNTWVTSEMVMNRDYFKMLIDASCVCEQLQVVIDEMDGEEKMKLFKFGVACCMAFVRANFTGPELEPELVEFLADDMFKALDYAEQFRVNTEDISVNTKFPMLFVVAKWIFAKCIVNHVVNCVWMIRALLIHQHILEDLSPRLLASAENLIKMLEDDVPDQFKAVIDIEVAQLYLLCRHISKAKKCIFSAIKILGVNYNLVGKLGKRTRYQETDVAQLTLEVTVNNETRTEPGPEQDKEIPTNLPLEDDVRLNAIEFSENPTKTTLKSIEQKLMLTIVHDMFVSKPKDELQAEEIQPFVDLVLSQKNSYTVRVMALLYRCRLEGQNRRTIERCLLQTEEIINSFKKETPDFMHRAPDLFTTGLVPIWKVEAQYADLLLNIGLVKNSLDIYLKLQQWEEVIVCYTILKMRHKAAEVIKQQLDKQPSVKLWCLLGDATDDVECYNTAWELSKKRSFRAQKHWGQYFYERKNYEECIPHFEKSVSINPLQPDIWFRLGFAALQIENWQTSATAFRRYTTLEPEGFEAWNNLAQAYIKIGNIRSAHQALVEALKCNFDNWKVWENFLFVSWDIGNFSDVIRAYHKLLDMKKEYLNIDILSMLVFGVINEISDVDGKSAMQYLKRTRELMGRVTSIHTNQGYVWELYSILAPNAVLRAQRLQMAYRSYTVTGWDKNVKKCEKVLSVCSKLCETVLDYEMSPKESNLNSIRLNVSSAVAAVRKQDWDDTRQFVGEIAEMLEKFTEKLKSAANST